MTLGHSDPQGDLRDDVSWFCEETLPENSVYRVLNREKDRLFPDEMFADLFSTRGRQSVPPSVVAVVMVLQRLNGLSDREAVTSYTYDTRWRFAAAVGNYGVARWGQFSHTVLVEMRARLAASDTPRRIFDVILEVASAAGQVGRKRVLDSAPLYDAVATMDTITLVRSAVRSLLRVADAPLETELRSALVSDDDYATTAKPQIDWSEAEAREALIDSRAQDALACLVLLEGRELSSELKEAAELLATVIGQDLEESEDGTYRIARGVAKDRVISTVDPEARHGRKTSARGFDGYKGHIAVDPDTEIITQTAVSAGNAGDAGVAADLIEDLVDARETEGQPAPSGDGDASTDPEPDSNQAAAEESESPKVYGDAAYGSGEFLNHLDREGIDSGCKTQPPCNRGNLFPKDRFEVDLEPETVTCPAGVTVPIHRKAHGEGLASFADACVDCALRPECTTATRGRTIHVGPHERILTQARRQQQDPAWKDDYRATRPKVERKLAHLMRKPHGGRRARMRGSTKIGADFSLLAAAHNLARLAVLGIRWRQGNWTAMVA